MLKAMRTGTHSIIIKYVLFGLLLLAMIGLALLADASVFSAGTRRTYVANIDGDKIQGPEFERMVDGQLRQNNIPQAEALRSGVPQKVLSQTINDRIFAKAAHDMGLQVDDATVAKRVRDMLKVLTDKGVSEKDALQQALRTFNISEGQLVSTIKSQMATETLLHAVSAGATASQAMVDNALRYRYEWRRGDYFTLTAADAGKIPEPSAADIDQTYKGMEGQLMLPEYRSFSVVVLDKTALTGDKAPAKKASDADLRAYYDAHKPEFSTTAESRVISQVVAKDEDTAKKVYAEAEHDKNLKKAAADAGKDKANFVSGTYAENDLPAELSTPAFKAKAGDVLPPVQTHLGWHVLYVEKVSPGDVKSFDSVKASIAKNLNEENGASTAEYDKVNQIDDMLAGGKTLADVAQQYGVKEVNFDKLDAQGMNDSHQKQGANVPVFDKAVAGVFQLEKGQTTEAIEGPNGTFVVAELKDVIPAQVQPLDTVRADIVKNWKQKQLADILDQKASKILEEINMGGSFDKAASTLGKSVQHTDMIQRGTQKASLPQGMLPALFSIEKTGQATTVRGQDSLSILRLADRRTDVPKNPKKEDTDALQASLSSALQNDILEQFRLHLMYKYDVSINNDVVEQLYKPKDDDK